MSRGRDGARRPREQPLVEGAYDHLVTEALASALEQARPLIAEVEPLDDADAHVALARHLAGELERALAGLVSQDRAEQARALTANLLEHLASLQRDDEAAEELRAQEVVSPARRLVALHRGTRPELPSTPLGMSTLLTRNRAEPSLGHELARELALSDRVDAILAFITVSGVRSLEDELHSFVRKPGARLRILTTVFTGTTELSALDRLARLPGAEVRISYDTQRTRLHAKAWLFHRNTGLTTAYVGSANLTATALGAGQEWMVKVSARDLPHVIDKFEGTFETLWAEPEFEPYDPDSAEGRERLRISLKAEREPATDRDGARFLVSLHPRPFQQEILDRLTAERALHGRHRNLVVAATGTGKTVIAALDYARQVALHGGVAPRLLFLAHREEILKQAHRTFQHALQDASFGELLVGAHQPHKLEHVFASIQSALSSQLIERLGEAYFRYVVVDECHHIKAASYQAVVPRLRPAVLVGLTATPERSDGKSLLPDFDGHIAAELRLWHALDGQLLVPFEYFGVSDGVDLKQVRWSRAGYDAGALGALYTGHEARADLIRHQLTRRVADVRKIRAIGFCVSIEHAEYMAARFSAAGIPSMAVHGSSPSRDEAPQQLRSFQVNVLFTCDLYNEGIDLPFVDVLLLLRPTQSATLFLQQLGRGLRQSPGKTSCLVLDFIGQHREEYRFDAIFTALTGIPRARLRKSVEEGFPYLPSGCALRLDAMAREQVLAALKRAVAGAVRLSAELRELAAETPDEPPKLARFLEDTGRDLEEVYNAGGWTTLKRSAGLLDERDSPGKDAASVDDLSRRLGWLLHIDEPVRLRSYREAIGQARGVVAREGAGPLDDLARRRLHMLGFQLNHQGIVPTAEQTVRSLSGAPAIADELEELTRILEDRVALADHSFPVAEWPLALHRHYARREIVAAVGAATAGKKGSTPQAGVLKLARTPDGRSRELLFVTLDKSGKSFSPTTRYRDYAISPREFHWETQAAASVLRPSGQRYISPEDGWQFFLFVRPHPDAAYAFLGRVHYQSHSGDRPISIVWRLEHPMPAALYDRYATLRQ